MMEAFDAVRRKHEAISAEAYNEDQLYKEKLMEVTKRDAIPQTGYFISATTWLKIPILVIK